MQENDNFSNNIEPILVQIYIFFSSQDGDSDVNLLFLFVLYLVFYYCTLVFITVLRHI